MFLPNFPRLIAPLALAALAAAPTGATLVRPMSFDEVVRESATIVHGKVVRSWSAWDDGRTAIWTHYEIAVEASLKGGEAKTLVISEPGGEVGGETMAVAGAPRYDVGEEVVAFAVRTPIGYLRTCGWGQGRFTVRPAAGSAGRRVVRAGGMTARLAAGNGKALARPAAAFDGHELGAFLDEVRRTVAVQSAGGAR